MKKPTKPDKVTVRIPAELHSSLKEVATSSSIPLQRLIEMLLERHVRMHSALFDKKVEALKKRK